LPTPMESSLFGVILCNSCPLLTET
jgi:hypothetical protein